MSDSDPEALREEISRARDRLSELDRRRARASARISELEARLASLGQAGEVAAPRDKCSGEAAPTTAAQKLSLFKKLFRGRTDVYARRWVNAKRGSAGYAPVCSNEWVHGVCEKPRIKCGECPNRAFVPLTGKTILDHLSGRQVVGIYPMLKDETCWFLAVDFDKGEWQEDVTSFIATCSRKDIPFAVERSRSGHGAHVWIFFSSPVPAVAARTMGCYLITDTMVRRHRLPLSSYDRLFPNQDTLPRGGFGNLIALPFQQEPRQSGNTVFVDQNWEPYPDQWTFLASVGRMSLAEVESVATAAERTGAVVSAPAFDSFEREDPELPWSRSSAKRGLAPEQLRGLPSQVHAVLAQLLFVETAELPSPLVHRIKQVASFQNPEFYKKQQMRLSTTLTPRIITCAEDYPRHVGLPRGCVRDVEALLAEHGVDLAIEDRRTSGKALKVAFRGRLTGTQRKAARALIDHETGVFVAPPGSGKTVVGVNLIARRARSTLVLVHRTQLLEQWISQLAVFLNLKPAEIGQIGGGKRRPNGVLDVAMIQSLSRQEKADGVLGGYGHVLVDECHHMPAVSFERVIKQVTARFVTGLTATPQRRDGHHPILRFHLGPTRFTMGMRRGACPFEHRLIVRETEFKLPDIGRASIQEIYRLLARDEERNQLIFDDTLHSLESGRSPLLLTERRDHLDYLANRLKGFARNVIVLRGGMKSRDRRDAVERLASIPKNEERLVLATGRFIGEGFDDARLDTLLLAMPISWKGTLIQYAGRLHRGFEGKREVRILDYVDSLVPVLARMFERRRRGYRSLGYEIGDLVPPEVSREVRRTEYDASERTGK